MSDLREELAFLDTTVSVCDSLSDTVHFGGTAKAGLALELRTHYAKKILPLDMHDLLGINNSRELEEFNIKSPPHVFLRQSSPLPQQPRKASVAKYAHSGGSLRPYGSGRQTGLGAPLPEKRVPEVRSVHGADTEAPTGPYPLT